MRSTLLALSISLVLAQAAQAADTASTVSTQKRIEALEARIQALEANSESIRQQAEAATLALESTRAEMESMKSSALAATPAATPESANGNAFNPAINLVLNGSYTRHSLDPDSYQRSGFPLVGEGAPAASGLSLGESELSFAANIDDKFYGQLTLAIGSADGNTELGIEEAFVDATTLPGGIALRVGRFFSNIGYLNSHHAHTDKFFDRPLPYQAFLGNQYGDDGVQLRWVAPTELFLEVGAELFRGQNYPSGGAANSGAGVRTLFAHAGGELGTESEWLAGVSVLDSRSGGSEDGFVGDNRLYIADATWKWAPEGNFKDGGVTVRGEYFLDDRDGDYVDPEDAQITQEWKGTRRGAYVEGVYRINRRWEAGYRYDRLWAGDGGPFVGQFDPSRHSVALTWINSEFSLVRLQYSYDRPNPDDTDNAITLQYQMNLGAHGAHKF